MKNIRQNTLNELAGKYNIKPEKIANFPHLEIAAIFLAHCSSYFLKDNGKLAFVLPRSFFSADHHDNTRSGKAKGFTLTEAWDLKDVSPLFRIPSCVLFAIKNNKKETKKLRKPDLQGREFFGRLSQNNCNFYEAKTKLSEQSAVWYYVKQGNASALSQNYSKNTNKVNPYKKEFKQGATIVPRSFYFVELLQEVEDFYDRIVHIKTSEAIKPDAKMPWKEIDFTGRIESKFLFRTALSKSILPFALYKPDLVVLPIIVKTENGIKRIELRDSKELQREGYLDAAKWFINAENIWRIHRTENNRKISSENYLNWQSKLTSQDLNVRYLVVYTASAKDANATVVDRNLIDLEFIVESKAYWIGTSSVNEALYVAALLNSSIPNEQMKDFQTMGLFGARDVHKKILDVFFPKFNERNKMHLKIAALSEKAHEKARAYIATNPPQQELSAIHLGRYRIELKKHLKEELEEIDNLVEKLIL